MSNDFKMGDCVELKNGGGNQKMTIDLLETYRGDGRAVCKWFNEKEGKYEKENFSVDALKRCGDNSETPL